MKYVVVSRKGDQKQIENYLKSFRGYSNAELVEAYNKQAKLGIVGVHAQALYLMALNQELKFRFGKSPIILDENQILSLPGIFESEN